MKVVVLTTDTPHHVYYAWKLGERFPLQAIFLETRHATPPFETFHPFEKLRDEYERDVLLAGGPGKWTDIAEIREYSSMNDADAVCALKTLAPDIVIVFGTGKLLPAVIQTANTAFLNLHGGDPSHYRGLDTHLWAIYHNDFGNLVTTLHHMDCELDTGDIVCQTALPLDKKSQLHTLRSTNTRACVELSSLAVHSLQANKWLPSHKQVQKGRYYSFMPTVLKEVCVKKFQRYVASL